MISSKMKGFDHLSADYRTRAGFSRVRKGRCYMKPPLGDYHTNTNQHPMDCYTRVDYQNRLCHQRPIKWDIKHMKSRGFVLPNLEEVTFSDILVQEPRSFPVGYQSKKTSKTPGATTSSNSFVMNDVKSTKLKGQDSYIKSDGRGGTWQKEVIYKFRKSLIQKEHRSVFGEYLNITPVEKKQKSSEHRRMSSFENDLFRDELIERARELRSKSLTKAREQASIKMERGRKSMSIALGQTFSKNREIYSVAEDNDTVAPETEGETRYNEIELSESSGSYGSIDFLP